MTWLERLILWLSARVIGPVARRRLTFVEGIEHLPADGPAVLVANHSSFFDHFLLAAAVAGRRSGRMYFLTKQESFSSRLGRLWFRSVGAIPIDRDNPKPDTLRDIRRVLSAGDVLCVYPEGTRGPGWPLQSFKTGAVRFALAARAPIIPIGIWGAQDILPKGSLRPRRASAHVVFGPALEVARGGSRLEQVESLTADAEATVRRLVLLAQDVDARDRARAARATADLAQAEIESALAAGDEQVDRPALERARGLLRLARRDDGDDVNAEVQELRIRGLRAMHVHTLSALRLALPIRRRAERVLARDAENAMAHYLLGRWHLRMPRALGARRRRAVAEFRWADELGGTDTRYAMGLAEALVATSAPEAACAVLDGVLERAGDSARERRRVERARAMRDGLRAVPSASAPRDRGRGLRSLAGPARRHPRMVVAAWVVLVAASAPFAVQLTPALKAGGFTDPRGQAANAGTTLSHAFGDDTDALFVVVHSAGDVRSVIPSALPAIERIPGLRAIRTYQVNPQWLARDHHTSLIEAALSLSETAAENQVAPLRARLGAALRLSHASAEVTGSPALDHDLNVQSQRDVERAEMLALPVLLCVLLLVFQSIAAVGLSLSIAVVAIVIANGIGFFVANAVGVSILFSNAVTMIGLAVGVDYGLFILRRFREERAAGADLELAIDRAMASAGKSVLLSGFAVLVALSTLLIPRVMVLSSIALGAGLVTCIALAVTMTLLPAVLRLSGERLSAPSPRLRLRFRAGRGRGLEPLLARLYRRPGLVLVAVAIGAGALVYPLAGVRLQVPVASASILPAADEARAAVDQLQRDLGTRNLFPVEVVLSAPRTVPASELLAAAGKVAAVATHDPRVASAMSAASIVPAAARNAVLAGRGASLAAPVRTRVTEALRAVWAPHATGTVTRVIITPSQGPDTVLAHGLVTSLRTRLPGLVGRRISVGVTGATAQGADFDRALIRAFPLIVGAVALVTFGMLALAFGSLLLPLIALVLNAIVVAVSMGVLVRLFQPGPDASINSVTPVLLFAVTFGLSMDYMVIMLSRMREFHRSGMGHRASVVAGVGRTALMVNGAAAIMVAVFVSFGTAQISIVRELGIGLAVAIALDALVIRLLVMPAALLVLGPRVWGRRAAAVSAPAEADAPAVGPPLDGLAVDAEADAELVPA